jgi:hypothetical protein
MCLKEKSSEITGHVKRDSKKTERRESIREKVVEMQELYEKRK